MKSRPRFRSLEELLAHTKGKGWPAVVAEFRAEYGSFDLTREPRNSPLTHALSRYDDDLSVFYHFLDGTWIQSPTAREQTILERLRSVRGEEGGATLKDGE